MLTSGKRVPCAVCTGAAPQSSGLAQLLRAQVLRCCVIPARVSARFVVINCHLQAACLKWSQNLETAPKLPLDQHLVCPDGEGELMQEHVRFRALVSSGLCVSVVLPATAAAKPRKCAHVLQNLLKHPKRSLKQLLGPKSTEKRGFLDGVQLKQADLVPKTAIAALWPENGERPRSALLSTKIALKIPSRKKKMQKKIQQK